MDFGVFAILGLLIAIFGIKVVADIIRHRRTIFDLNFTDEDRTYVSQAAFLILLPVTVAFHELGHAALVTLFGADVTSWGFYFFSGFVGYRGFVTETQQILIAAAGVTVNLLLGALALAFVFLRRPPMRPAINELLIQATTISVANALIFYPLLDLATDLNGDFRQMYFGGVPWLSAIIFAIHAGVLVGAFLASRSDRISARLGELTGLPPHIRRGLLGGLSLSTDRAGSTGVESRAEELTAEEATMRAAGRRVASGWAAPIEGVMLRGPRGSSLLLRWTETTEKRGVAVVTEPDGTVTVRVIDPTRDPRAALAAGRVRQRWSAFPDEDSLTLAFRIAMEEAKEHSVSDQAPHFIPEGTSSG